MIVRTYKYWLRPNKTTEKYLSEVVETHRRIYNEGLYYSILGYEFYGKAGSINKKDLWNYFSAKRKVDPYLAKVNARSISYTIKHLDQSFQNFFRRVKQGSAKAGFPKFKGRDFFNTIRFGQSNGYKVTPPAKDSKWGSLRMTEGQGSEKILHNIRVKFHRPLPKDAKQKEIAITREGKRWYIAMTLELPDKFATPAGKEVTGIDVGLKTFAVDASGNEYGDTRTLEARLPELRRLNRGLARKTNKQSNRRRKHKENLSALHRKIRNIRRDVHNKVAKELIDTYGIIGVENLNVEGLAKSKLARRVHDAGWGGFLLQLQGVAEQRGGQVVPVPAKNTTQACSSCGEIVPKSLSVRTHKCPHCGLVMDRDENAAINIKNRAVEILNTPAKPKPRKRTKGDRVDPSGVKQKVASVSPKICNQKSDNRS